jgi:hypothetical protein
MKTSEIVEAFEKVAKLHTFENGKSPSYINFQVSYDAINPNTNDVDEDPLYNISPRVRIKVRSVSMEFDSGGKDFEEALVRLARKITGENGE